MVILLDENLTDLMKDDWNVSSENMRRARKKLANFFKVMSSPEAEEIVKEPWMPKDEEMWAIREATNRKIYLTVMWYNVREIITAIIFALIAFFWTLPMSVFVAIVFAALFAIMMWLVVSFMRPSWHSRLYHDRGMYHQSFLADAFYGEINPLSIGERAIRPKPAWITRFIN